MSYEDDLQRHHEKLTKLLDNHDEMMQAMGAYARNTQKHLDKAYNSDGPLPSWYKTAKQSMDDLGLSQIMKQVNNGRPKQ